MLEEVWKIRFRPKNVSYGAIEVGCKKLYPAGTNTAGAKMNNTIGVLSETAFFKPYFPPSQIFSFGSQCHASDTVTKAVHRAIQAVMDMDRSKWMNCLRKVETASSEPQYISWQDIETK